VGRRRPREAGAREARRMSARASTASFSQYPGLFIAHFFLSVCPTNNQSRPLFLWFTTSCSCMLASLFNFAQTTQKAEGVTETPKTRDAPKALSKIYFRRHSDSHACLTRVSHLQHACRHACGRLGPARQNEPAFLPFAETSRASK
jgi:hypothetical protein